MRLLICAGMTGGGVYPALAVLQALENKAEAVLWVGSQSGLEKTLLSSHDVEYQSIPAGGIHGINFRRLPKNLVDLGNGYIESRSILKKFQPDVVFYTGGYVGVPMALAAKRIPSVVFVPDIEPGLALKMIMRGVDQVVVSTDLSKKYIKTNRRITTCGYPLRTEITKWSRGLARKYFKIGETEKCLLVFGGSKGAQSINQAILPHVASLSKDMHIIHITGTVNWDEAQEKTHSLQLDQLGNYHAYPFLHEEMGAAFAASDLAVCRAGASTIGELPYFGLPAILVPYPHAWQYQYQNATYLSENGGAVVLKDADLQGELNALIQSIMNDSENQQTMAKKMSQLSVDDASLAIAKIVEQVGNKSIGGKKYD